MPLKNILCWHKKSFGLSQKVWDRHNQYVNKFLVQQKKIGPAQNILGPVEGQGINATQQRVWHHCARELNAVDSKSTFVVGTNK